MRYSYMAVEGLIGAGKTTLARRLAQHHGARLVLEEFEENPFLPRFYEEPERYAFSVELSFLAQRYHQLKRVTEQDLFTPYTVADYSLGKSLIFASVTLPPDEFTLFRDLYGIMYDDLPRAEVIVYLHLSTDRLKQRIAQRGRSYEQTIAVDYLLRLQDVYMDHLNRTPGQRVLVVDIGERDLLEDADAFRTLTAELETEIPPGVRIIRL
jgi:deoxyguanosine kinase